MLFSELIIVNKSNLLNIQCVMILTNYMVLNGFCWRYENYKLKEQTKTINKHQLNHVIHSHS